MINLHFFSFSHTLFSLLCTQLVIFYWSLCKNCIFEQYTNATLNSPALPILSGRVFFLTFYCKMFLCIINTFSKLKPLTDLKDYKTITADESHHLLFIIQKKKRLQQKLIKTPCCALSLTDCLINLITLALEVSYHSSIRCFYILFSIKQINRLPDDLKP